MKARKNPIDDKDLAPVFAWLFFLKNLPSRHEEVPAHYKKLLVSEQLWNDDELELTDKGEMFLEDAIVSKRSRKFTK